MVSLVHCTATMSTKSIVMQKSGAPAWFTALNYLLQFWTLSVLPCLFWLCQITRIRAKRMGLNFFIEFLADLFWNKQTIIPHRGWFSKPKWFARIHFNRIAKVKGAEIRPPFQIWYWKVLADDEKILSIQIRRQ